MKKLLIISKILIIATLSFGQNFYEEFDNCSNWTFLNGYNDNWAGVNYFSYSNIGPCNGGQILLRAVAYSNNFVGNTNWGRTIPILYHDFQFKSNTKYKVKWKYLGRKRGESTEFVPQIFLISGNSIDLMKDPMHGAIANESWLGIAYGKHSPYLNIIEDELLFTSQTSNNKFFLYVFCVGNADFEMKLQYLSIEEVPTISITQPNPICAGTSSVNVPYTATGSPDQYRIDWNDLANSAGFIDTPILPLSGGNIVVSNLSRQSGTYWGNLYVKKSGASTESSPVIITIKINPSVYITGPTTICSGSSAVLTANISSNNPNGRTPSNNQPNLAPSFQYIWSTGQTTPSITITNPGTYTVTVIDLITGCSSTARYTVSLQIPVITSTIDFCANGYTQLIANAPGANSIAWSNGQTGSSIYVNTSGSYFITAQYSSGCSSSSSLYTVGPCSTPCDPLSINRTSTNSRRQPCIAQNSLTISKIYPNKADREVSMELSSSSDTNIEYTIYNQFAIEVKKGYFERGTSKSTIETTLLPNGLYILQVYLPNRVIKERIVVFHE